eukprot:scaffold23192_cov82-Cyclotella_meneghiniana.AAC.2
MKKLSATAQVFQLHSDDDIAYIIVAMVDGRLRLSSRYSVESSLRPGVMLLLIRGAGFGQKPAGMGKQPSKSGVLDSFIR